MIAAESIVRALKNRNLTVVFGVPGIHNLALFESLRKSGIRTVVPTQELNAGFMADGYGRVAGSPGVCITCPGPGITSISSAVAEAAADSSPLVIIAVDIRSGYREGKVHDLRQEELMRLLGKRIFTAKDNDDPGVLVEEAFKESMSGEPGPVFVSLAADSLEKKIDIQDKNEAETLEVDEDAFIQVVEVIRSGGHCGIYAGKGALGGSSQIILLAEMLKAPVATSVSGRGVIPEDHSLSAGFLLGECGNLSARKAFEHCDIILAFGCAKMSELATAGRALRFKGRIVLIDSDHTRKDYFSPWLFIRSDAPKAVEKIIGLMREHMPINERDGKACLSGRQVKPAVFSGKLTPRIFFGALREYMREDAILVTDTGNHQLWAINSYPVYKPYSFLTPADFQALGFGIPAAIGAKLAFPEKDVVCVTGDGGFLVGGFEILTAVRESAALKVFVINDGGFSLLRFLQEERYQHAYGTDCILPDLESLARSFQVEYVTMGSIEELKIGMDSVFQSKGSVIVNVKLEKNELAPYISRMRWMKFNNLPFSEKISALSCYLRRKLRL